MGIIGDREHLARAARLEAEDRQKNPTKYAMVELTAKKQVVVGELVTSARKNFVEKGTIRAVTDLRFNDSFHLVNRREAEKLIADWLHEEDPSLHANVVIGPDCSGNMSYAAEVVVEFTPVSSDSDRYGQEDPRNAIIGDGFG